MAKTNETKTLGIIGQVYEDRRNGVSGRLISRDEKCKTLMFQSADGNTFVKSNSHFRSYMRKKSEEDVEVIKEEAYAEAELTPIEVSDEDAVKMEKNAERKAKAKERAEAEATPKPKKERMSDEAKSEIYESMISTVSKFVESFNNDSVECKRRDYKQACSLKVLGKSLLIFYIRTSKATVYVRSVPQLVSEVKHSVTLTDNKHHSAKTASARTESYSVALSDLEQNLEDLREAIIEIISYKKESEEK